MNRSLLYLLVWVLSLGLPAVSQAGTMILDITDLDTGDFVSIIDNMFGDDDPASGIIGYSGGLIGNFFVLPTTSAVSKPNLTNGPSEAIFDLHVDALNIGLPMDGSPATLQVRLTDTDFTLSVQALPWLLTSQIGGLTGGTVAYQEIYDPDNSAFATDTAGNDTVNDFGVLGSGLPMDNFDAVLASDITTRTNPFSLTEVITIEHSLPGRFTGFDSDSVVNVVPEPSSSLMWAVGACVILCSRRSRRRKGRTNL